MFHVKVFIKTLEPAPRFTCTPYLFNSLSCKLTARVSLQQTRVVYPRFKFSGRPPCELSQSTCADADVAYPLCAVTNHLPGHRSSTWGGAAHAARPVVPAAAAPISCQHVPAMCAAAKSDEICTRHRPSGSQRDTPVIENP